MHPMNSSFDRPYEPKFALFQDLMRNRIQNILLVSSLYDNFILEEDGRLSEKLFEVFSRFNLSIQPRITRVASPKEALNCLHEMKTIDLVITMRRLQEMNAFEFGRRIKEFNSSIPVVLLLNNPIVIKELEKLQDKSGIDRIFLWGGDSDLFFTIIKLFEDALNVERDVSIGRIPIILLIENSIRFFSVFLPMLYSEIMKLTQKLVEEESLNEFHRLLRMSARPKILLAETYEEGEALYSRFRNNIMGVISDVAFPRNGVLDQNSGTDFLKMVKTGNQYLPTILMSSQAENAKKAAELE